MFPSIGERKATHETVGKLRPGLKPMNELMNAARERGRDDVTVRSLVEKARNRRFPAVKLGNQWHWDPNDLDQILKAL